MEGAGRAERRAISGVARTDEGGDRRSGWDWGAAATAVR